MSEQEKQTVEATENEETTKDQDLEDDDKDLFVCIKD